MAMIVNTAWLLEYLDPPCTHQQLLEALPAAGLEIEAQHDLGQELAAVRIGFVRKMAPIPGAEGMHACQIEIERGRMISVVCASEHEVRVGWGVPVAEAGTSLPGGREIRGGQFHGVASEGMICLDAELGLLARGTGMQHFTDESTLGKPLTELVNISEHLIELNVLPNRPDFLGVIGIAREVAGLLNLKLRFPKTLAPPTTGTAPVKVEVREPELCPRYLGALVRGVKVAPSPAWLKARLLVAGMRPINNIVDITNYVLYEYGQPLHAFDFRTIHGGRIVVRRMSPGESLELLTGKSITAEGQGEKKFARPPLVIADAERPIALAGIMGGAATQMVDDATDVLVEAACFDSVNIRQTVREVDLGMEARGTASSYRFERGTDANLMIESALRRALHLITELAGGSVAGPVVDVYPKRRDPVTFRLSAERTSSILGMPVDAATIRDRLTRLEMKVDADLTVHVPTWRVHVDDPVVLIEDVARMVGYDQIPTAARPTEPTLGLRAPADCLRQAVADFLASAGFFESRNPSLESPQMSAWLGDPSAVVSVANALSQDMSVVRRSLLPGLVRTVDNNIRRGAEQARFFEIDRVFDPAGNTPTESATAADRWRVAGIAGGHASAADWRNSGKPTDFYLLKGVLEDLLEAVGCRKYVLRPVDQAPFIPGTSAELLVGDQLIGHLGQLDRDVVGIDRLPFPLFAFELELELLQAAFTSPSGYRAVSRQPAVTRDLAIVVPVGTAYAELEATIREQAGEQLESLRFMDLYQGSQVAEGSQSLAFHMVLRDPQESMTAEDAAAIMERIVTTLSTRFGAQLRA
jgi:phenylalanyl-tRNA synthetase beta chain